jgi:hypothetical protein
MTAIAHLLTGAALYELFGHWAWLLAFLSHGILDATCLWHPPGMHRPWVARREWPHRLYDAIRRSLLDEWQYDSPRTVMLLFNLRGVAEYRYHPPARAYRIAKWGMFLLNLLGLVMWIAAPFLGWLSWSAWFVGWVAWMSWDIFWLARDLAPDWWYRRHLYRYNPHRLADWLRRVLRLPSDWLPGAAWEFAVIAAAWWLA